MKDNMKEPLPKSRESLIRNFYSKRKADYICSTLSEKELFVIDGTIGLSVKDYLALSKVEKILQDRELSNYIDKNYMIEPESAEDYRKRERLWMQHEWDILELDLHEHGINRNPTRGEFIEDFNRYQNGLRFKLFYLLSNPDKVVNIKNGS